MNKSRFLHIIIYIGLIGCIASFFSCGSKEGENSVEKMENEYVLPDSRAILSSIKQNADLVTTEVTVRKICIYDSSKHEKYIFTDLHTWKYGKRMCIVPIEVKIKYGYDLREMSADNIKLTDDSTAVIIQLPKAKIVDAGYNLKVEEESVVSISTGLRDEIGHEVEEEIRRKGYETVMKEDISKLVGNDVETNAKSVFESIVKSLGYKDVAVVVISNK